MGCGLGTRASPKVLGAPPHNRLLLHTSIILADARAPVAALTALRAHSTLVMSEGAVSALGSIGGGSVGSIDSIVGGTVGGIVGGNVGGILGGNVGGILGGILGAILGGWAGLGMPRFGAARLGAP